MRRTIRLRTGLVVVAVIAPFLTFAAHWRRADFDFQTRHALLAHKCERKLAGAKGGLAFFLKHSVPRHACKARWCPASDPPWFWKAIADNRKKVKKLPWVIRYHRLLAGPAYDKWPFG
jgi:hypothetical protein